MNLVRSEATAAVVVKRVVNWSASEGDYDVVIEQREGFAGVELSIGLRGGDRYLPLVRCFPRHVEEVEGLAAHLPALLPAIAAAMREAGLVDLRSDAEKAIAAVEAGS